MMLFQLPPMPDLKTFDDFWAAYPRKTKRMYAKKCWDRALRQAGVKSLDIVCGARAYADKVVVDETKEQFVMHASTFLNQCCWTDYLSTNAPNRYDTRAWEAAGREWLYGGKRGPAPKLEDFPRTEESP